MMKKFAREYFGSLQDFGITGGAGLVASTVWDGVERFIPFQKSNVGAPRFWVAPIAQLLTAVIGGPILGMWAPRLGTGLGVALASEGGKRLFVGFLPNEARKAIFGQVEIQPLDGPSSSAYYPPTVDVEPGTADERSVLLGEGMGDDMGQEATSTTIVPLGGFADASPVLLERVMSAIV